MAPEPLELGSDLTIEDGVLTDTVSGDSEIHIYHGEEAELVVSATTKPLPLPDGHYELFAYIVPAEESRQWYAERSRHERDSAATRLTT